MNTRYYVFAVQHNKNVNAENRVAPKGYNSWNEALKEFHRQISTDMGNATLDWSFACIIDSDGLMLKTEKWVTDIIEEEPDTEEEPIEPTE